MSLELAEFINCSVKADIRDILFTVEKRLTSLISAKMMAPQTNPTPWDREDGGPEFFRIVYDLSVQSFHLHLNELDLLVDLAVFEGKGVNPDSNAMKIKFIKPFCVWHYRTQPQRKLRNQPPRK